MKNEKYPIDKVAGADIHAAAGAGVVAVVGNIGLAVAGGAIGIDMLPVEAASAIAGLAIFGAKKAVED